MQCSQCGWTSGSGGTTSSAVCCPVFSVWMDLGERRYDLVSCLLSSVLCVDEWDLGGRRYDLVSCLLSSVLAVDVWDLGERRYDLVSYLLSSVLGVDEWDLGERRYDLVSCLNLLDRCSRPLNLLRRIRAALTPATGRLLVAVVLPFRPYVEQGRTHQHCSSLCTTSKSGVPKLGYVQAWHRLNRRFDQAEKIRLDFVSQLVIIILHEYN